MSEAGRRVVCVIVDTVIFKLIQKGDHMTTNAYEAIEEIYPRIVKLMDDEFDSHEFILMLAQKYQKLYVQALYDHRD